MRCYLCNLYGHTDYGDDFLCVSIKKNSLENCQYIFCPDKIIN